MHRKNVGRFKTMSIKTVSGVELLNRLREPSNNER